MRPENATNSTGPPAHANASARAREVHALKAAGQSPARSKVEAPTPDVVVTLTPEAEALLLPTAVPEPELALSLT